MYKTKFLQKNLQKISSFHSCGTIKPHVWNERSTVVKRLFDTCGTQTTSTQKNRQTNNGMPAIYFLSFLCNNYLNFSYALTNISSFPMARMASQLKTIPAKGKHTIHEGTKVASPFSI